TSPATAAKQTPRSLTFTRPIDASGKSADRRARHALDGPSGRLPASVIQARGSWVVARNENVPQSDRPIRRPHRPRPCASGRPTRAGGGNGSNPGRETRGAGGAEPPKEHRPRFCSENNK